MLARGIVTRYDRRVRSGARDRGRRHRSTPLPKPGRVRKVKNCVATRADRRSRSWSRWCRSSFLVVYVVQQGVEGHQLELPHRRPSRSSTGSPGGAWARRWSARCSSPARRRSWRSRSGSSAASTSTSTAGKSPLARLIRFLVRGDDRRAVDRDGPVHLHVRRAQHEGAERLRGRARAGLPDAADRHPHHRPDALAGAARAARGQLRARELARRGPSAPSCSRMPRRAS